MKEWYDEYKKLNEELSAAKSVQPVLPQPKEKVYDIQVDSNVRKISIQLLLLTNSS